MPRIPKKQRQKRFAKGFVFEENICRIKEAYAEPIRQEELDQAFACWRKVYFGSEAKAVAAAKERGVENQQKAYPCPYCRGWHLAKRRR